jgi:hypothetical protein
MTELKQKYELMKQKYTQMASSSSQLKQLMIETRDSRGPNQTDAAQIGSQAGPYQSQPLLDQVYLVPRALQK